MNETAKIIISVLVTIIVTFLVLGIIGLTLGDTEDISTNTQQQYTYADMREGFMSGCSPEGQHDAYCNCAFDGLKENYTRTELYTFFENPESPATKSVIREYSNQCRALYNSQQI